MVEPLGLNTLIVTTLQKYGTIPAGYLAKLLGRRLIEIQDNLDDLQRKRIIEQDGENIYLSSQVER